MKEHRVSQKRRKTINTEADMKDAKDMQNEEHRAVEDYRQKLMQAMSIGTSSESNQVEIQVGLERNPEVSLPVHECGVGDDMRRDVMFAMQSIAKMRQSEDIDEHQADQGHKIRKSEAAAAVGG